MSALRMDTGFAKKIRAFLWILIPLLGWINPAQAQKPQDVFQRANALYGTQQYDSSWALYQQLLQEGYSPAALYYNAGNTAYQLHKIGYAVYYFEKARESEPDNPAILHNLELAKQQRSDRFRQPPEVFLEQWWHSAFTIASDKQWMGLSLLLFWLLLLGIGYNAWIGPARKLPVWMLASASMLFALSFFAGRSAYRFSHPTGKAILVAAQSALRSDPDLESSTLGTIHEGCTLRVVDQVPGWSEVVLPDGKEGWVGSDTFRSL